MSEFECCPNPKCSIDLSSNPEYRFCIACGTALNRKNVFVECCRVLVTHPWAQKRAFVPFCPICGKPTGQISPSVRARKMVARKKMRDEEEAQREKAINPPLLSNVQIQVRKIKAGGSDSPDDILLNERRCRLIIKDVLKALCNRDHRVVVVAEGVKQLEMLYKFFESDVARIPLMQAMLVWDYPSSGRKDVIRDQFFRGYVVFATVKILDELDLPLANQFFVASPIFSEGWLKTVSRLASPANRSKDPKIFEYVDMVGTFLSLHQKKMQHYEREGAIIERKES